MKIVKENGIFLSIQGEGSLSGVPTTFVRLQGCNLHCEWCDTQESWDDKNAQEVSNTSIADQVMSHGCPNVCFTGGEPFLQWEDVVTVCRELSTRMQNINLSIETNMSIFRPLVYIGFYSFSPKIKNWPKDTLSMWVDFCLATQTPFQIKVVCNNKEDAVAALTFVGPYKGFLHIQPLWGTENMRELIKFCKEETVRLSIQTHKYLGIV